MKLIDQDLRDNLADIGWLIVGLVYWGGVIFGLPIATGLLLWWIIT